jgi:hypothetical protein
MGWAAAREPSAHRPTVHCVFDHSLHGGWPCVVRSPYPVGLLLPWGAGAWDGRITDGTAGKGWAGLEKGPRGGLRRAGKDARWWKGWAGLRRALSDLDLGSVNASNSTRARLPSAVGSGRGEQAVGSGRGKRALRRGVEQCTSVGGFSSTSIVALACRCWTELATGWGKKGGGRCSRRPALDDFSLLSPCLTLASEADLG